MFKTKLAAFAMLCAGTFAFSAAPASALTAPPQPAVQLGGASPNLTEVSNHRRYVRRNSNRVIRYDRRRHGARCNRYYNNCRHYYRGYYYASPWWTLPVIGAGIVIGSGGYSGGGGSYNRHVEWCLDRYRSYNVRTNTFVTYGGEVRQCRSPYR